MGGILAVLLLVSRNEWALLFTNPSETEVVQLVASLMPSIVISIVGVAWSTVLSGKCLVFLSSSITSATKFITFGSFTTVHKI